MERFCNIGGGELDDDLFLTFREIFGIIDAKEWIKTERFLSLEDCR